MKNILIQFHKWAGIWRYKDIVSNYGDPYSPFTMKKICLGFVSLVFTNWDIEAYEEDLRYRFSCVVEHATGGRLSKTNYAKEVYYTEIDDYMNETFEVWFEEERKSRKDVLL